MSEIAGTVNEIFSSFQGEGLLLGQKQIFVRFSGCNLRCGYCDTLASQELVDYFQIHCPNMDIKLQKNPIYAEKLDKIIDQINQAAGPHHSISITGGEPLVQTEFLYTWLKFFPPKIPIHLETNGTLTDNLISVIDHIDWVGMDLKLPSVTGDSQLVNDKNFWDKTRLFLEIASFRNVFVKIIVSKDLDIEELKRATHMIASVDKNIPVYLQPVTLEGPGFKFDNHGLTHSMEICKGAINQVCVQPQMHKAMGFY